MNRIIGKYKGNLDGPLLVITAGIHGNESAGVRALQLFFKNLNEKSNTNPDFVYKGEVIGLLGNVNAYSQSKRFIEKDMNRCWVPEHIGQIMNTDKLMLKNEDLEMRELLEMVHLEVNRLQPSKLYLLDLHTTSSDGGIFSITTAKKESINTAYEMHAPVVLGLLKDISGTTLHYFTKENIGIPCISIGFESGHHDDLQSIDRCVAAIINFIRAIGVIDPQEVENHHDYILKEYIKKLPEVVEVVYKFKIEDNKLWQMKPGYKNFQKVKRNELLARYDGNDVLCPMDGRILMPLYQSQGEEGFFIVRDVVEW
ncbi:MAG: succinylglutamate desuccinylase/aspartoacylase family protein [Saprospiraceae bacterium]